MAGARLGAAGLFLLWGGVAVFGEPPLVLQCPLLDERGTPAPRPALLRILGGPEEPPEPPRDPERTFDVTDPWGALRDFWGPSGEPPRCELSPTAPLPPPPGGPPRCHPGQGQRWWLLALGTPGRAGTALLRGGEGNPPRMDAALVISTLTPELRGLLGTPQTLHCSLTPPGGPFTLRWLQPRGGVPRPLLTFDSATASVRQAAPGALLLLGGLQSPPKSGQPAGGALELSLQLRRLSVLDDGSFVCSVTTPLGQLQQVLRMNVIAPPQVSVRPSALSPGLPAELRCDALGFFPLDVTFRWERRGTPGDTRGTPGDTRGTPGDTPGTPGDTPRTPGDTRGTPGDTPRTPGDSRGTPGDSPGVTWSSGHRRAADGTYRRSSGLRVTAATPGDSYTCLVTHPAWDTAQSVTVRVADASGPSVEDVAGVALVAFAIGGLCVRLWPPAGR